MSNETQQADAEQAYRDFYRDTPLSHMGDRLSFKAGYRSRDAEVDLLKHRLETAEVAIEALNDRGFELNVKLNNRIATLTEALENLVTGLEQTNWSSWQNTSQFTPSMLDARTALAEVRDGGGEK